MTVLDQHEGMQNVQIGLHIIVSRLMESFEKNYRHFLRRIKIVFADLFD